MISGIRQVSVLLWWDWFQGQKHVAVIPMINNYTITMLFAPGPLVFDTSASPYEDAKSKRFHIHWIHLVPSSSFQKTKDFLYHHLQKYQEHCSRSQYPPIFVSGYLKIRRKGSARVSKRQERQILHNATGYLSRPRVAHWYWKQGQVQDWLSSRWPSYHTSNAGSYDNGFICSEIHFGSSLKFTGDTWDRPTSPLQRHLWRS